MDTMDKFEDTVASWHTKFPHLSDRARGWLADNLWWLALIVVIFGIAAVMIVLSMSLLASMVLAGMAGIVGATAGNIIMVFVAISMMLTIVNAVLLALAVSPLRRKDYRGWRYLFVVILLNLAASITKVLFDFKLSSLVMSLLLSVLAAYLIFEVRDRFAKVPAVTHVPVREAKS